MSKEDVKLFTCYGARASGRSYMEHLKAKDKEIERLNKRWKVLRTYINEMWLDDKGSVRRLQEFVKLLENGSDKE